MTPEDATSITTYFEVAGGGMTGRDYPISIQKADGGYVIMLGKNSPPIIVVSHEALEVWLREFYLTEHKPTS